MMYTLELWTQFLVASLVGLAIVFSLFALMLVAEMVCKEIVKIFRGK